MPPKPVAVAGGTAAAYPLDALPAAPISPGLTYSAQLHSNAPGFYRLSDAAPIMGQSLVMHAEFSTMNAASHAGSWITSNALRYARVYRNTYDMINGIAVTTWSNNPIGTLSQSLPAYSGVQEIHSTVDDVYVRTTGLGHHVMGPWQNGALPFPNVPINQQSLWRFPRAPVVSVTKSYTDLGVIGYFVGGVAVFDPWSGEYHTNGVGMVPTTIAPGGGGMGTPKKPRSGPLMPVWDIRNSKASTMIMRIRWCVTPEFPMGTYANFILIETNGDPVDFGRFLFTGKPGDKGKIAVPSLRNVALTTPYMHDGRFATLEEVIEHCSTGVERGSTLDPNLAKHPSGGVPLGPEDKRALVAFLKTLSDDCFLPIERDVRAAPKTAAEGRITRNAKP